MTKKDFNQKVSEMCAYVKQHKCDDMREQLKPFAQKYGGLQGGLVYGMWCEKNFERNLREDYKRITTYTSDFSIAEWCVPVDGMNAIASTLRNALTNWRDNVEWFCRDYHCTQPESARTRCTRQFGIFRNVFRVIY